MSSLPNDVPLLMTPGPTRVPERVLRAAGHPMIHHRTPDFSAELKAMIEMLGPVFGTASNVMPVHTTGRGAMEAAVANLFCAGDEVAASCNGEFGEMWATIAETYGLVVHRFATDWMHNADPQDVDALLKAHPAIRAVFVGYGDTSTGVQNDVAAIASIARAHDALTFVDGVSSIGGMPFRFDDWGIDVAVTASQKCLMSGPGLAFVAMSDRAWAAYERATLPRFYWDFDAIRKIIARPKPETPGTTPVQLVLQVTEALRMLHEEGLPNVWARHSAMAQRAREGAEALGFTLSYPKLTCVSTTVTAISAGTLSPTTLREGVLARGIRIAVGLGPAKETGFRIGHMGDIRVADVDRTIEALGEVVASLR
jgi:aspartate aminotransferase-like enzyme